VIRTGRLELVMGSVELLDAALAGPDPLARGLEAEVPASWPPEYVDAAALQFIRDRVAANPVEAPWWMYFIVLPGLSGERLLIGTAGYKGPPSDGTTEVGYSIVAEHQRRGYATEAVDGLLRHAFDQPEVNRVIAETLPELTPSIGVLRKSGFEPAGEGSEPGVIRFELTRASYGASGVA
jgi:[ribosomal protein S5]-alanine N-acetyltransferase